MWLWGAARDSLSRWAGPHVWLHNNPFIHVHIGLAQRRPFRYLFRCDLQCPPARETPTPAAAAAEHCTRPRRRYCRTPHLSQCDAPVHCGAPARCAPPSHLRRTRLVPLVCLDVQLGMLTCGLHTVLTMVLLRWTTFAAGTQHALHDTSIQQVRLCVPVCSASGLYSILLPQVRSRVPVRCICCAGMPGFCMMPG